MSSKPLSPASSVQSESGNNHIVLALLSPWLCLSRTRILGFLPTVWSSLSLQMSAQLLWTWRAVFPVLEPLLLRLLWHRIHWSHLPQLWVPACPSVNSGSEIPIPILFNAFQDLVDFLTWIEMELTPTLQYTLFYLNKQFILTISISNMLWCLAIDCFAYLEGVWWDMRLCSYC